MKTYIADNRQITPPYLHGGLSARVHSSEITFPEIFIHLLNRSANRCALSHPSLTDFNFMQFLRASTTRSRMDATKFVHDLVKKNCNYDTICHTAYVILRANDKSNNNQVMETYEDLCKKLQRQTKKGQPELGMSSSRISLLSENYSKRNNR